MIRNKIALTLLLLIPTFVTFGQDSISQDSIVKPVIKMSFLDSIKSTFIVDETTDCIDNQFIKELSNTQDIFDGLASDIKNLDLNTPVVFDLPTDLFKERLRLLDEKSPFNIEYNTQLENLVKNFLKNRKRSYERLMGLSQYYFPMFEEAMARYNVPLEIKYLAIVESALRSNAVSRVGATGIWQFMYETGKQYGLKIDSYVDERRDTYKASDAAARYMEGMYKIFGDWELVLASYNSGAGNVSKAIRRSGGHQNFWNIKNKLPKETASYVPAFLATMYIFEYHKEHGIVPYKPVVKHFETDTIALKKKISFKQLASLLDVSESDIEFLNPSYKMKVVPYVTGRTHFICLPKKKIAVLASNEAKVYAYLDNEETKREKQFVRPIMPTIVNDTLGTPKVIQEAIVEANESEKDGLTTKYHSVKRGENLNTIATKYNVSIADVKKWNRLKSNHVLLGAKLRVVFDPSKVNDVKTDLAKNEAIIADAKSKKEMVSKNTDNETAVAEHTVQQGETLFTIAKKHHLYVADLKKWNNLDNGTVSAGDVLKLKLSPENTKEVISQIDFYTVKKGDNIGNIAKANNVTIEDLKKWNNLTSNNIKVGEKLKIEKEEQVLAQASKKKSRFEEQQLYIVQKGDSLFSISQRHNTTVAEIKKKNNIKDNELQPGMKLKL
jgi:membrane-bound lytic murein transglycosylase D